MRRQKKKIHKKIMWSALGLLLVVFSVAGYYVHSLYSFADKINADSEDSIFSKVRSLTPTTADLEPPKWEGKERVNILLLGGDSRGLSENEIPRSDSLMIASLDPVSKKTYLFSILRDTYVSIPDHGSDRINTAIARGGPELAMKTVSNLMGIPIQYYVYTDFKGFIALVDALGGIDLEVEKDMKYSDSADGNMYDIDLKQGYQHLDGTTALQYVRFRHDATSDFTRTERQRKFMKALAEKLQSTTSLIKLPSILQSVDPYIETNLNVNQMIKLASLGFELKTDGMISQQIPPMELLEEKRVGGAEVLGVDPARLQVFVKQLFGEAPTSTKAPSSGGKLSQGTETGSTGSSGGTGTKATPQPTVQPTATPQATVRPTATPKPTVQPSASGQPAGSPAPEASQTPDGGESQAPEAGSPSLPPAGTGDEDQSGSGTDPVEEIIIEPDETGVQADLGQEASAASTPDTGSDLQQSGGGNDSGTADAGDGGNSAAGIEATASPAAPTPAP